ncbi:MAG: hypothetical protein AAF772_07840 [Acidobacteriota bacterium]
MADNEDRAQPPDLRVGRYRLNLLLFLLLIVPATLWMQRHVEPLVTRTALFSGTLSLWGLWKLVESWLPKHVGDDRAAWTRAWLGTRGASEFLLIALVVLAVLYGTTSSIYLDYAIDEPGQPSTFTVEVARHGNPWMEPLEVTSRDRNVGRPFFLDTTTRELTFTIVEPPGYAPLPRTLRPWSSIKLDVPGDFDPVRYALLRIVPGTGLFNSLPPVDAAAPATRFTLVVRDAEDRVVAALDDVRRRCVLLGAEADVLDRLAAGADADALRAALTDYLVVRDVVEAAQQAPVLSVWTRPPVQAPVPAANLDLAPGDTVTIEVRRADADPSQPPVVAATVALDDLGGDSIQTVFLEATR